VILNGKTFRLVLVFVVEKDGTLGEVKLEKSSGMKEFDDAIIDGIKELKRNGLPRKWAVLL
jgi:TonB family protein